MQKRNKYGAIKTEIDGIVFDSKAESYRYLELKILQQGRIISGLKTQQKFPLMVNDKLICTYIADFTYYQGAVFVVEDTKGVRTPVFNLKAKLFEALYGYKIRIDKRR